MLEKENQKSIRQEATPCVLRVWDNFLIIALLLFRVSDVRVPSKPLTCSTGFRFCQFPLPFFSHLPESISFATRLREEWREKEKGQKIFAIVQF